MVPPVPSGEIELDVRAIFLPIVLPLSSTLRESAPEPVRVRVFLMPSMMEGEGLPTETELDPRPRLMVVGLEMVWTVKRSLPGPARIVVGVLEAVPATVKELPALPSLRVRVVTPV